MRRRSGFRSGNFFGIAPNTFIGGVASTIPDSATLATKLNIPESEIKSFEVVGNDIKAAVNVNYTLDQIQFGDDFAYYRDEDGKCLRLGRESDGNFDTYIRYAYGLYFPNAIYHGYFVSGNWTYNFRSSGARMRLYMPKVLNWGASHGEEVRSDGTKIFRQNFVDYNLWNIYVHPSMLTINNGGLEGDLAFAQSRGATIVGVDNFTKPANITDLSYTTNGTDVTLNFTPPTSTNTLDFYQVYVNGFYKQEITGSGAVISGLSNGDKITVYACDEYYNRSLSNEVIISGI
jgi:hypothetical protein